MIRKVFILSLILMLGVPSLAEVKLEDLDELNIRPPAYRVGLTDEPEKKYVEVKAKSQVEQAKAKIDEEQVDVEAMTYADLSIKKISKEISKEIELDNEDMMGDLTLLWQGAAAKSDTISFALYKLSNPEEDKPDDKSVKKVLLNIAKKARRVTAPGQAYDFRKGACGRYPVRFRWPARISSASLPLSDFSSLPRSHRR